MIMILISFFSSLILAEAPIHWSSAFKVSERHEFYENDKEIVKPKDSWQVLFAVVYPDVQLNLQKDCVYYKVPGAAPGEVKIKKMPEATPCESALFAPGDSEWKDLKSLTFATNDRAILVNMMMPKYKTEVWKVDFNNLNHHPEATMSMSSAEYKSPGMILLAPGTLVQNVKPAFTLKEGDICHQVSDDCSASASLCLQCPNGWYEVPNGCAQGPKYCGQADCGTKNAPACRRGMSWKKPDPKFSCREDASFAYCNPGLKMQCEGSLAYCR